MELKDALVKRSESSEKITYLLVKFNFLNVKCLKHFICRNINRNKELILQKRNELAYITKLAVKLGREVAQSPHL